MPRTRKPYPPEFRERMGDLVRAVSVITVIDGLTFTISDGWERLRAENAHCLCRNPWPHGCAAVT